MKLTDDEIWEFWWNKPEVPEGEDDSMEAQFVAACRRAIETEVLRLNGGGGEAVGEEFIRACLGPQAALSEYPRPWSVKVYNTPLGDTGDFEGHVDILDANGNLVLPVYADEDCDEAIASFIAARVSAAPQPQQAEPWEAEILMAERDNLASAFDRLKASHDELAGALAYHQDQTRPIQRTIDALANAHAAPKPQHAWGCAGGVAIGAGGTNTGNDRGCGCRRSTGSIKRRF